MTRRLWVVLLLAGCSASQDAGAGFIDCGQEAGTVGTVARVDGGGLAEAPRGFDAGAGVDACPDAASSTERAPAVDVATSRDAKAGVDLATLAEVSRDTGAGLDLGAPLDLGATAEVSRDTGAGLDLGAPLDLGIDADPCPNPGTVNIDGNCFLCGTVGNVCCKDRACAVGLVCNGTAGCAAKP